MGPPNPTTSPVTPDVRAVVGEQVDPEPGGLGRLPRPDRPVVGDEPRGVHPGHRAGQLGVRRQRGDDPGSALGVGLAGRPDDRVDVAVAEQRPEGALDRPRGRVVGDPSVPVEGGPQVRRGHQPPEPQRRCDRLGRGPEVGRALGLEGGERWHRGHVVAELRVVVVLDHQAPSRRGRGQQREPVRGGHHPAQRVLVGGCDVGRADPREVGDRLQRREVDDVAAGLLARSATAAR